MTSNFITIKLANCCRVCFASSHRYFPEATTCSADGNCGSPRLWTAGASGLVIERAAADRLRLPCIGEIHVSGVAGKTRSCFRRSSSIQVATLSISCSGGLCHEGWR